MQLLNNVFLFVLYNSIVSQKLKSQLHIRDKQAANYRVNLKVCQSVVSV